MCEVQDVLEPDEFPSVMDWVLLDDKSKPRVISCDNVINLYCAAKFLGMPGNTGFALMP